MKIAYGKDFHTGKGWAFGAARVGNKIYIGNIDRKGYDGLTSGVEYSVDPSNDANKWLESRNR